MSYFSNYENNSKIPYDDIPINRNERYTRGFSSTGRDVGGGGRSTKKPSTVISLLVVVSLILNVVCIYLLATRKTRVINQYSLEMSGSSEVSTAVKASAYLSSVSVAAGGTCTNESTFYTATNTKGSGIIYKVIGNTIYFVTCHHVISGNESKVWVMLPTGLKPLAVSVVGYSSYYDLAVLKYVAANAEYTLSGSKPVTVFDSVYAALGEKVFAVGNSLSTGLSITDGVISQVNELIKVGSNTFWTRALKTSTEINPGNSGGGLYNDSGKLIGLVSAKRHTATSGSETITVVGTSFAIPSTLLCGVADKLISGSTKPTYINLGATFVHDTDMGKNLTPANYDGTRLVEDYTVKVGSVTAGSIAYGKLHSGDVIESIEFSVYNNNGERVTKRVEMFNKYVFEDYSFSIIKDSRVRFYLEDGNSPSTTYVDIIASSLGVVSD